MTFNMQLIIGIDDYDNFSYWFYVSNGSKYFQVVPHCGNKDPNSLKSYNSLVDFQPSDAEMEIFKLILNNFNARNGLPYAPKSTSFFHVKKVIIEPVRRHYLQYALKLEIIENGDIVHFKFDMEDKTTYYMQLSYECYMDYQCLGHIGGSYRNFRHVYYYPKHIIV